jgi:nucleotide-binding universal stress UspA family protein
MTIIVGLDGSPASQEALAWAIDEGERRESPVRVVYAWTLLPAGGVARGLAVPIDALAGGDAAELAAGAQRALEQALAGVRGAERVERRVASGHPAEVLIEEARDAELLVVGSRGHGTLSGALLGSVSHACIQHATCPVVVVRRAAAAPAWSAEELIERERAQNVRTWEALCRLGVEQGRELPLEFVYETGGAAADRELAAYLRSETDYEVTLERGGVSGLSSPLALSLDALDGWVARMVLAGYEHGGCAFDGWTATLHAGAS